MTTIKSKMKPTRTLKVDFEYCYGIKKLDYEFDFSESHKTFSIYAQNGSMKTSFAKVFENIAKKESPKDVIFPDRESKASITFDGNPVDEEIFVINSYEKNYISSKVSTLLVNKKLQDEFEKVHSNIDELKSNLLKKLKTTSKVNKIDDIEKEISKTFYNNDEGKFFEALERILPEINNDDVVQYKEIKYKELFDEKVIAFLENKDTQDNIAEYIKKYEELLDKSTYFKKGIFNHSQAEDTADNLNKNGFFEAKHAVLFGNKTIKDKKELTKVIEGEKEQILGDKYLKQIFQKLDDKITKNQGLKNLRDFLSKNSYIISDLSNLEKLKAELWKYYLHLEKDSFNDLMEKYSDGKKEIESITKQAENEKTDWLDVIEIFNDRFLVPFRLTIANKVDVLLQREVPAISFEFIDVDETKQVNQGKLMRVLSQGEKRALYLLHIIFEIRAREKFGGTHIFIIDDIADSFDYKNKYAIIEYLMDISKTNDFYQILLSHNFDFHRTVSSRLSMGRENKLVVSKSSAGIELEKEFYQHSPFNYWREHLNNDCFLVASIPFVRNLAEYSGNDDVKNKLTKFLHIKQDTETLTVNDLKNEFEKVLNKETDVNKIVNTTRGYFELLDSALKAASNGSLESKIVKSIAIRLEAEKFIIKEIFDENHVHDIGSKQTRKLVEDYVEKFPTHIENKKILDKVQLMTPESIHINSFMYEPLLDMSNEYLDQLYTKVLNLNSNDTETHPG